MTEKDLNPTQKLIKEFQRLQKEDPAAARALVTDNQDNELFVSLIKLHDELVPAICAQKDFMIDGINSAMLEEDPMIRQALVEHVKGEAAARVVDKLEKKSDVKS